MKKTVTANISGLVFHVDEDAYEKLNIYLSKIRGRFTSNDGGDEIMADIESRIAEMLQDKTTNSSKQVVTLNDVNEVISQLGEPEQIAGEEGASNENEGANSSEEKKSRRLYRDTDKAIFGGVASGLANYFQVDVAWLRVAFVLLTFLTGFGLLAYIVLWIAVPAARTIAEKLEMKGERVNISNIEKAIQEEFARVEKNLKELSADAEKKLKKEFNWQTGKTKIDELFRGVGTALRRIIKVIAAIIGVVLFTTGFFLLIALLWVLFNPGMQITNELVTNSISIKGIIEFIFTNPTLVNLSISSLALVLAMPLIGLIYGGCTLIFGAKTGIKYFGAVASTLWFSGMILGFVLIVLGLNNFTNQRSVIQETAIKSAPADTLLVTVNNKRLQEMGITARQVDEVGSWPLLFAADGDQRSAIPQLTVFKTSTDSIKVVLIKEARGNNPITARQNARNISYKFTHENNNLILDPFFNFNKADGWRSQEVKIEVHVPEGVTVEVADDLQKIVNARWNLIDDAGAKIKEITNATTP